MIEELTWNNVGDIVLAYRMLDESQGFKIYQKTIDYDNTGKEVIVPHIIPSGYDLEYSHDISMPTTNSKMARFLTGVEVIAWTIGTYRYEVNLKHIDKIEIIDNPIDEIMEQEGLI